MGIMLIMIQDHVFCNIVAMYFRGYVGQLQGVLQFLCFAGNVQILAK